MSLLLSLLFLFLSISCKSEKQPPPSTTQTVQDSGIGTLNGTIIEKAEFEFYAGLELALVYSYFKTNHNLDADSGFWQWSNGKESPLELLKERTLAKCIDMKTRELLARKLGLPVAVRFSDFVKNFEAENQRRADNLESNKPVYGNRQFTLLQYHLYVHSNLENHMRFELRDKNKTGDAMVPGGMSVADFNEYVAQKIKDADIQLKPEVIALCLARVTAK